MKFTDIPTPEKGIIELSERITSELQHGKKVLWLISGGSNIPIAVMVMKAIREQASAAELDRLTVSLTDERYGVVGHADSNWAQLIHAGFVFGGLHTIPVLRNLALDSTVSEWGKEIGEAFIAANTIIGQFGVGADGHIAGILPKSPPLKSEDMAAAYDADVFTRITLTPWAIQSITAAYAFVFGPGKKEALHLLETRKLSVFEQPAQILKEVPEAVLYSNHSGIIKPHRTRSSMAKKILIIEDEPNILKLLSEKLSEAGFTIIQALDGASGLDHALKEHPNLILLDLLLPGMDGMVMLRKLREDDWGKKAEIMILTNLSDNKRVAEAMTLGVYEYLVKSSWDMGEVVQKIKGKLGA